MRNLRIDEAHEFEQEKGAVIAELDAQRGRAVGPGSKSDPAAAVRQGRRPTATRSSASATTSRAPPPTIIKSHYDKWYHPNNASLVIVGGFDPDKALAAIKKLFGPIPAAKLPPRRRSRPIELHQAGPAERWTSKFDVPRLVMGFNTVRIGEPADYAAWT